jgi:hypothetical protein
MATGGLYNDIKSFRVLFSMPLSYALDFLALRMVLFCIRYREACKSKCISCVQCKETVVILGQEVLIETMWMTVYG